MQTADGIDRTASAQRQIRHVERLGHIVRVLASQGEQLLDGDAQPLFGVMREVLFDERGRKQVGAGGHRRVGGEQVSGARGGQGGLERLARLLHEIARALQDGKCRMAFVEMANLRL